MARDVQVSRWLALGAVVVQAGAWAGAITRGGAIPVVVAIALQLTSLVPVVWQLPCRRRLAAALGVAMPVLGPLAATLAATVSGDRGADLMRDPLAEARQVDGEQIAHALVNALPACDALASADREIRRASIARLAARGSASDVAVLRWARSQSSGELAVEIALALEDIGARFEHRASAARTAAAHAVDYETRAHTFRVLVTGICSGIVDEPIRSELAAEARHHHEAAIAADGERARELLADRARLELAVDRPDVALELLAPVLRAERELIDLYQQAAYAARRFELTADAHDQEVTCT